MRRLPLRSPPRVRGKAKNRCRSCPLTRITPAYAGKSRARRTASSTSWDHPRVCGEKRCGENLLNIAPGSPPRMRGKAAGNQQPGRGLGITPACAGKSSHQHGAGRWRRDHPRVCGEKAVAHIWWYSWIGSPPRMRGKDGVNDSAQAVTEITPACAGKRPLPSSGDIRG